MGVSICRRRGALTAFVCSSIVHIILSLIIFAPTLYLLGFCIRSGTLTLNVARGLLVQSVPLEYASLQEEALTNWIKNTMTVAQYDAEFTKVMASCYGIDGALSQE